MIILFGWIGSFFGSVGMYIGGILGLVAALVGKSETEKNNAEKLSSSINSNNEQKIEPENKILKNSTRQNHEALSSAIKKPVRSEEKLSRDTVSKRQDIKNFNNFDNYKNYTIDENWDAICELNNVDRSQSKFGGMKELNALPEQLQSGEVVFGFTAGIMPSNSDGNATDFLPNTWLVVLTDRRFLFLDSALLSSSIDVHSIQHKNVQGVLVSQGFIFGKLSIDTGSRSTIIDNCEKKTVKVLGDLANDWLQVLEDQKSDNMRPLSSEESGLDKLKKLAELKELGALNDEEFNIEKAKILSTL